MEESTSYYDSKSDNLYHQDGYSSSDERSLRKILEPPDENMDIILARKKMFSSSSFYEEPHHIYPTMEEQVDLCRKIADSLSADTNKLSKGQSMYNRRKQRAEKWVFEGPDPKNETNPNDLSNGKSSPNYDGSTKSSSSGLSRSQSAPQRRLKLVLDPRELQDAMKLRNSGLYNEHNVVSPDICFDLVRDLNSPTGKGAALFAKRKKKSEKWIVDEHTVKKHEQQVETETIRKDLQAPAGPSSSIGGTGFTPLASNLLLQPRLKLIKSPWDAALESPIGCCDAAFMEVVPGFKNIVGGGLAQTVLRRAEERSYTNLLQDPLTQSGSNPYLRPNSNPDLYKPRGPRGWDGGFSTDRVPSPSVFRESPIPDVYVTSDTSSGMAASPCFRGGGGGDQSPVAWSLNRFNNFNNAPRSWGESDVTSKSRFRSVRPPTSVSLK